MTPAHHVPDRPVRQMPTHEVHADAAHLIIVRHEGPASGPSPIIVLVTTRQRWPACSRAARRSRPRRRIAAPARSTAVIARAPAVIARALAVVPLLAPPWLWHPRLFESIAQISSDIVTESVVVTVLCTLVATIAGGLAANRNTMASGVSLTSACWRPTLTASTIAGSAVTTFAITGATVAGSAVTTFAVTDATVTDATVTGSAVTGSAVTRLAPPNDRRDERGDAAAHQLVREPFVEGRPHTRLPPVPLQP